ncbi:exodeoxyribonuclease V subunit gamma [Methylomonas sp. SURF-1]|uniref:RecBCD enzyme subunit RecC n=1 Tax=Methylomonas aurea TaxID=2952224 RepID=A0ABT1UCC5_9GAMM|nr:exodeoxyribonuclease V subunit gamma [Methylomonas sp. SURF-1]MCQ8179538.1 exodeoxyribonuclease V subunit gamma [Methylomonas sp. SURF-1]
MFVLHSSNKTENLLEHLVTVVTAAPLSSPFAAELFLIQSQGMERWLSQQLAVRLKVWGHFSYLFPAKFFAEIAAALHDELYDPAFDRHWMLWRFEGLLRDLDGEVYQALRQYLVGENAELKRYQLAQQLARVYDQYQMLRPDLLEAWQARRLLYGSPAEAWQAQLWRAVVAEIGQRHRGAHWLQAIAKLQQAEPGAFAGQLPERVSVFGVNSLPPLMLTYLQALSRHCDVHLYLLNPVQGYWADLPPKRLLAELQHFDGHPLLVRLGQQGREFQQMLLEQAEFAFEPSSFEPAEPETVLQCLQNDVLANRVPQQIRLAADASIGIHACHSRLREVQVLKDQLLQTLEHNPDLELRDIVVMAPDIQAYAPFISAVFDDIQHAVADRSLKISDPLLDAFVRFLKLSQSRLGWRAVMDLLEQPLIHTSFGLATADLELIAYWLQELYVRWGRSGEAKQAQGLPPTPQNTWQAGLERLFMGYALAADEFVDDILPYPDIEGSTAQALGGLNAFLQLLFRAGDELATAKTLSEWQTCLSRYADSLLAGADTAQRQALNELLAEMAEMAAIHDRPLALAVIVAWLQGRMDETKSGAGFLRGQLTFCSMLPMRSIPFQIIALLGMNDGEFPKIERQPTFDLLAAHPRLGDRSRRADDRYQFLEILLSARRQLIVTYLGQSLRDNSEIPPSPIVSELLEVLRDGYGLDGIVVRHPLHPFSQRYFLGHDPNLFSYARHDCDTARRLRGEKPAPQPWWSGALPAETDTVIEIDRLRQFFHHPQRYFFRHCLELQLPSLIVDAEEREPFALNSLEDYLLAQEWLDAELQGKVFSLAKLQARGLWPAGAAGEIAWRRRQPAIAEFAAIIAGKQLGEPLPPEAIDLAIGDYRLVGKLGRLHQHGGLIYRFGKLKGRDFFGAWLQHLIANRIAPQATHLVCVDADLRFPAKAEPDDALPQLLAIFRSGQIRPDAFFTEAALDFVRHNDPETALATAAKRLADAIEQGYEAEIGQLFAYRDLSDLLGDAFSGFCRDWLEPAWRAAHAE